MRQNYLKIGCFILLSLFSGCQKTIPEQMNTVEESVVSSIGTIIDKGLAPIEVVEDYVEKEKEHCSLYENLRPSRNLRDPNKMHIHAGKEMGMKEPFRKNADFLAVRDSLLENNILQYVPEGKYYRKKRMHYSYPYMTPEAIVLLNEISERFHQKLMKKNMQSYSLQLTSCLRTMESQQRLRGSNLNATRDTSSHVFGASFDISYWEFYQDSNGKLCQYKSLQKILNQAIKEIRNEKKCLVIKETGQFCFHCTVIR